MNVLLAIKNALRGGHFFLAWTLAMLRKNSSGNTENDPDWLRALENAREGKIQAAAEESLHMLNSDETWRMPEENKFSDN